MASSAIEAAMLARPLRVPNHVLPVMRDASSYSRDQPVNLRQFASRLNDDTRCRAQAAGHGRERSRARSCRAGKRKQTVLERSVRSADRSSISTVSDVSTWPLPAARQRHVGLPLPQFASFNARSLRNKVDASSEEFTIHGINITSALFSWSTPLKSHWRLCTCLTPPDWTAAETVWHSSTGWLTRV